MNKFIILLIVPLLSFGQFFVINKKINENAYSFKNLNKLNNEELRIARNTIFAYYGRPFKSDDLKKYFSKKRWYKINYNYNDNFVAASHKKLIDRVLSFEKNNTDYELLANNITLPRSVTKINKDLLDHLNVTGCSFDGKKKSIIKACNYENNVVRDYAIQLINPKNAGYFNIGQLCDLFDHYINNWTYVNDPNTKNSIIHNDYNAKASQTIKANLRGDCDDFAIVLCSSILAIGGEARISTGCSSDGCHAWAEVNIGNQNSDEIFKYLSQRYNIPSTDMIYYFNGFYDLNNRWLNLDWFTNPKNNRKHPGTKFFDVSSHGTWFYIIQKHCMSFGKINW